MDTPKDKSYFITAPAKINLSLDVERATINGRHPLTTIMQSVSLCDRMMANVHWDPDNPTINLKMTETHGLNEAKIPDEDNLVYRAILKFVDYIGRPLEDRIDITLQKNIPSRSGLGGGSADCAAAIAFMAILYGLEPDSDESIAVARSLGSDVAFFLRGGCAVLDGYGDRFREQLPSPELSLVLARPLEGLGTGIVYQKFDEVGPLPDNVDIDGSEDRRKLIPLLRERTSAPNIATLIGNSLQYASMLLEPNVERLLADLKSQDGVLNAMVSGSGSACFAICTDKRAANKVCSAMREYGWWAVTCKSVPFGAGVGDPIRAIC